MRTIERHRFMPMNPTTMRHLLAAALILPLTACAQLPAERKAQLDAVMEEHFTADDPGGVVLVAQGDKILYLRALGMADVAANKPLTTNSVLRIGSVTKQFTGVAILQLAEQGKLKLTDEIQQHVDFPKKEHPITIEHLVSHTSGIPNFTDLPGYNVDTYGKDISIAAMVDQFKDLPLEFEPGTKWSYSNSGYILLTAIIEKVSGLSWTDYAEQHLLRPAGMTASSASINSAFLPYEPGLGYQKDGDTWVPAFAVSLAWPRGAGAIRSTVGDLLKWNTAVHKGTLLSPAMREKAFTAFPLADGSSSNYGYGWMFMNVQASPTHEHSGGINGSTTNSIYLPNEEIYVAVLVNRESDDAHNLAPKLAAIALGKPYGGIEQPLTAEQAQQYTGVYVNKDGVERYITFDAQGLHSQRQGGGRFDLRYLGNDRFLFSHDVVDLTFQRSNGQVTGALFQSRDREEHLTRTDKPLPKREAIALKNAELQAYVGEYELAPGFTLIFRAEGDRFFVRATGQQEIEVFGSAPHEFFLTVVDASMTFHPEADGSMRQLTFRQGGEMQGTRVK
ncbi:MAG: serine hydrolase [Flavobacteriales bacterium]|nr:serine hydrolase [Flavobacteriales bacterium]